MGSRGNGGRLLAAGLLVALVAACSGTTEAGPAGTTAGPVTSSAASGSSSGPTTGTPGASSGTSAPSSGSPSGGTATASGTVTATAGRHPEPGDPAARLRGVRTWVYQLQNYRNDRLDQIAAGPHDLVVVDLARDAGSDWFTAPEIVALHKRGKVVLAYFEIGSIENFRPEYAPLRSGAKDLVLNRWADWPQEYFVRYWEARWWDRVVRPRVDQALRAGFDGVYLDTPLAYEEIDLKLVPGWTRQRLARAMADLVIRISRYGKARRPGFLVFPQNSPELRHQSGYTAAIDGIGMEELFFLATDTPCTQDWCPENLREVRALRAAGKVVLAVDYASTAANVRSACSRYTAEHFVGYVADLALDNVRPPCR